MVGQRILDRVRPRRVRRDRPLQRAVGGIVILLRARAVAARGQAAHVVIAGLGLVVDVVGEDRVGNDGHDDAPLQQAAGYVVGQRGFDRGLCQAAIKRVSSEGCSPLRTVHCHGL
jgi:hypothetical protein